MAIDHAASPRRVSAGSPLSEATRAAALASVAAVLLLGFAVVVVREIVATLGGPRSGGGDPYQLFAVSLTGLAGGVFAVALRSSPAASARSSTRTRTDRLRGWVGTAFVFAYIAAGCLATLVCLIRLGDATTVLKSLAATFIGTSVAAASALFGVHPDA